MKYDRRMGPIDNWRFTLWRPLVCRIRGHKVICYKVVPTNPQEWFTICHRCAEMSDDKFESCGGCNNGCSDNLR